VQNHPEKSWKAATERDLEASYGEVSEGYPKELSDTNIMNFECPSRPVLPYAC